MKLRIRLSGLLLQFYFFLTLHRWWVPVGHYQYVQFDPDSPKRFRPGQLVYRIIDRELWLVSNNLTNKAVKPAGICLARVTRGNWSFIALLDGIEPCR